MEKIDRLVWTAGFTFESYGVRVGVRTNNPEMLDLMKERLPPTWKPVTAPRTVERIYSLISDSGNTTRSKTRRFKILYGNFLLLSRTLDIDEALDAFESDVQLTVAEMSPRRVFVHAGVVGWLGQAILFPGRSFTGKTTLVAELVRAGATYYSDEYAVLDHAGRLHPYTRPLAIRKAGEFRGRKTPVESIGGRAGTRSLPVGLIVVTNHKAGARWRPQSISAGQGALELLANTVSARRQPAAAMRVFEQILAHASVIKSSRGEASATVAAILSELPKIKQAA